MFSCEQAHINKQHLMEGPRKNSIVFFITVISFDPLTVGEDGGSSI